MESSRRRSRASHKLLFCVLLSLLLYIPQAFGGQPDPGPDIGTTVTFLVPNAGEWPFVDLFKTSLPWVVGPTPPPMAPCSTTGGTLNLDPNGWIQSLNPGEVAYTFQFLGAQDKYPSGNYTVLYEGQGNLEYEGAGTLVSRGQGFDIVHLNSADPDALCMTLLRTDPTDHLRNIRLLPPGGVCSQNLEQLCQTNGDCGSGTCRLFADNDFYQKQIFHPTFLENMENYQVVRFMHWMQTNESTFTDWSDYPQESEAHWNVAPASIMAELGNRLDANLWINVPHLATDLFVQELADELARHLNTHLKVYVEYSSETWNPAFLQFMEITRRACNAFPNLLPGCATDLDPTNNILCEGHPDVLFNPSCEEARRRFHSRRSKEVWNLFVQRFGGQRVVRVMASQSGETQLHLDLLTYDNAWQETDVLSTALYFGYRLGLDPDVANWDLGMLFDELRETDIPDALDLLQQDMDFLANHPQLTQNISYMNYEGGQHLVGIGALELDPDMNDLFDDANREDEMGERYQELLDGWVQVTGGDSVFMHYVNGMTFKTWGRFGALEYQDQPHLDAVKFRTLMTYFGYSP